MTKCMPKITTINGNRMIFNVIIVEVDKRYNILRLFGGGSGYSGKKVGEASVILEASKSSDPFSYATMVYSFETLYLDAYRDDGRYFDESTKRSIVEACKKAAKAYFEG